MRFGCGSRACPAFEFSSPDLPVDVTVSFLFSACCGADGRCFCGAGGGERDLETLGERERDSFFGDGERDRLFLRSREAGFRDGDLEGERERDRLGEGDLDEEAEVEDDENDDDDDE